MIGTDRSQQVQLCRSEPVVGTRRPLSLSVMTMTPPSPVPGSAAETPGRPAIVLNRAARHFLNWNLVSATFMTITILVEAVLLLGRGTDPAASLSVQQAVTQALDSNTPGAPGRLISAKLTGSRDATVEFVLTDRDDGQANRAAALADVLAIARALYAIRDP